MVLKRIPRSLETEPGIFVSEVNKKKIIYGNGRMFISFGEHHKENNLKLRN